MFTRRCCPRKVFHVSRKLLVLGYHNIEPTWAFPGTTAAAGLQGFDRQLRALRRWAHVVPLSEALTHLAAGRPLPGRAVALTFDDGYRDAATVVAPLLAKHGLPATFFLVPGFLSGQVSAWWEELAWAVQTGTRGGVVSQDVRYDTLTQQQRDACVAAVSESLKRLSQQARLAAVAELVSRLGPHGPNPSNALFMSWDDAQALLTAGFDIGSHTCGHPILSNETAASQTRELAGSKAELEARLGRRMDLLAFPNGRAVDYDDRTLRAVQDCGYTFALTTRTGFATVDHAPFEVRRVVVGPETDLRRLVTVGLRTVKHAARTVFGLNS